ncbi:MAG: hypothetical protein LUC41_04320, partial [Clostridiales bacterium]|nr:hypothetical protein [Clostridiales bacterium]
GNDTCGGSGTDHNGAGSSAGAQEAARAAAVPAQGPGTAAPAKIRSFPAAMYIQGRSQNNLHAPKTA